MGASDTARTSAVPQYQHTCFNLGFHVFQPLVLSSPNLFIYPKCRVPRCYTSNEMSVEAMVSCGASLLKQPFEALLRACFVPPYHCREVHSGRGNPGHPVGRNATPLDSHEEKRQPSQVPNEKAGCGEDFRRSLVGAASPALSRVAGTVVNVTHVLLPLAPLAVEVPTITAHARVVWPWLRAVWPFGFVPTPHWLPVQHLGSQFSTPRYGERRLRSHTVTHGFASRSLSRGHEAIRCCSCDAPSFRMAACGNVGGEHEPTLDCSRAAHRSHGPRDRRSVLSAAGVRLATVAVAAVVTSGTSAARTASAYPSELGTVEQQVEHDDGLSLKSKPGFGSKAFTRDSYDSFASGYDDLDGGWAASAMRIEVRLDHRC